MFLSEGERILRSANRWWEEQAVWLLANRYDLRHREAEQRGDYDEAFLDWIFCGSSVRWSCPTGS